MDAVLISHDHYDHLDLPTVERLVREQEAPFVVPLGIGSTCAAGACPPTAWSSSTGTASTASAS